MEDVFYSWLGASASAPLVMVLSLWTTFVFHTYRRRWRTVDLFLLATTTQQFLSALFAFGFSMISLISPRQEAPCGFVLWGLTTTRVFQLCTLTSLVVDRALTVRWPYRYRFSVRRNQIRYHIAVMSIIAIFVGVAGVFARPPPQYATSANQDALLTPIKTVCSLQPLRWDIRFSIFLLSLYAILLLASFICFVNIEFHRCRPSGSCPAEPQMSVTPVSSTSREGGTGSSGSMTSSTGSSGRPLQCPGRQESRRPYGPDRRPLEFRWPVVATVSALCYSINHIPYGVLCVLSLSVSFWTQWHDNIIIWLRLAEGFLVPLVLYITDSVHRGAVKKCFQRRRGSLSGFAGADDRRFRLFFEEAPEKSQLSASPFYTLSPLAVINYKRTSSRKGSSKRKSSNPRQRPSLWTPMSNQYMLPTIYGIDPILDKSKSQSAEAEKQKAVEEKEAQLFQQCAENDSSKYSMEDQWQDGDSHIYATLSDTLSNYSFQSTLVDDSAIGLNNFDPDDDVYDGSFTTLANDDFEFHDTRPCGGEVKMRPSIPAAFNIYDVLPPGRPTSSQYDKQPNTMQTYNDTIFQDKRHSVVSTSTSSVQDLVLHIGSSSQHNGIDNPSFEEEESKECNERQREPPMHVYRVNADVLQYNGLQRSRPTSLSMNDLELIGSGYRRGSPVGVPTKSESMMSLYKPCYDDRTPPSQHLPVVKECNENEHSYQELDSCKVSSERQWHQRNSSPDIWRDSYLKKARRKLRSKKWRSNQDVASKRASEFQAAENDPLGHNQNKWRLHVAESAKRDLPLGNLGMQRQFFSDLHLPASTCKYRQPCRDPDCCKLIISEVL